MEVKYRHTIKERDTKNLRAFLDKPVFNAPFGILLTLTDDVEISDKRIVALPLSSLLLAKLRPPLAHFFDGAEDAHRGGLCIL